MRDTKTKVDQLPNGGELQEGSASSTLPGLEVPARWLVGICGSLNATVVPQHISVLKSMGIEVSVILSHNARKFVTTESLQALVGKRVFWQTFGGGEGACVPHVDLPMQVDVFVVMPASYDVIGKVASGIADDLLTSSIASAACPVLFVPAMNPVMWGKPALRRNIRQLRSDGYHVVAPGRGLAASGKRIDTTMPQLGEILEFVAKLQSRKAKTGEPGG